MGKFLFPALVILIGAAATYYGYQMVKGAVGTEAAPQGSTGRFLLGQVIRPESEWEKNKMAQGILMTLG